MSVHAPLANRRQTLDTASLRQDEDLGLFIGAPSEVPGPIGAPSETITLDPMVTTPDEPTGPTTVSAKTLAQDPGFIWLAAGTPDFPAFTTWTQPTGTGTVAGGSGREFMA